MKTALTDSDFPILIAEDNEDDVILLKRALRLSGFENPFHISENGLDVITYLKGEGLYEDRNRFRFPRLLITDLKMPRMDGFELLEWIQKHRECSVIPRIVLSASARDEDVQRAYRLGANSYIVKPMSSEALIENLRIVFAYWQMCLKPKLPAKC